MVPSRGDGVLGRETQSLTRHRESLTVRVTDLTHAHTLTGESGENLERIEYTILLQCATVSTPLIITRGQPWAFQKAEGGLEIYNHRGVYAKLSCIREEKAFHLSTFEHSIRVKTTDSPLI